MSSSRRILFILDLNGTILNRVKKDIPGLQEDFRVRGDAVYIRPHCREFLKSLFNLGDVAVWTSSRIENATPMVLRSFSGVLDLKKLEKSSQRINEVMFNCRAWRGELQDGEHSLAFLWSQQECDEIPQPNSYKPLFLKDLHKVWKAKRPVYTPENTIMIDDTEDKLRDHGKNHLAIPEFNLAEDPLLKSDDSTLLELRQYLTVLSKEFETSLDVRKYLADHPFSKKQITE